MKEQSEPKTAFDKICEQYGLEYSSAPVIKALLAAYQLDRTPTLSVEVNSDLISREKAIKAIRRYYDGSPYAPQENLIQIIEQL